MGYIHNILYGKQARLSILLISGKAYDTAYATQLWGLHERCGLVEPQVWKTQSKPTNSRKLFMVEMVADQEDPEQWHLNM